MGMFLNRGTVEFEQVLNSQIYIDKTDMILELNHFISTEQRYLCVSRPRRFGKSVTANMIAAYYERDNNSAPLFADKKIAKKDPDDWNRHMNQYNVIRIDLAGMCSRYETPEKAMDMIEANLLKDLSQSYPFIFIEEGDKVTEVLDHIYQKTKHRFIIIIDEWDAFFRDEKTNFKIQQRYIQFLRSLFKDNHSKQFLALAYITGILPIKRYHSESALNNFYEYTMIEPSILGSYIGFTDDEVKQLCYSYHMNYQEIKDWYDGYTLDIPRRDEQGNMEYGIEHIYGSNSVVQAMLFRKCNNYWSQTVAYNSILTYITMNFDGLKDDIISMISGQRIPVKVHTFQNDMVSFRNKHDVLTVLIHLGYLGYDAEDKEVWIPNKEVRMCFEDNLEETGWSEVIETIQASEALLLATLDQDEEEVAEQIDLCHSKNTSILKYNDENALACVLTLAYFSAKKDYIMVRELPAGRGFADIVFLPKKNKNKPAMIVELKWKQDANTALKQIKQNNYIQALDGYHGSVLLVGINYDKVKRGETPQKKHSCIIEEIQL